MTAADALIAVLHAKDTRGRPLYSEADIELALFVLATHALYAHPDRVVDPEIAGTIRSFYRRLEVHDGTPEHVANQALQKYLSANPPNQQLLLALRQAMRTATSDFIPKKATRAFLCL